MHEVVEFLAHAMRERTDAFERDIARRRLAYSRIADDSAGPVADPGQATQPITVIPQQPSRGQSAALGRPLAG